MIKFSLQLSSFALLLAVASSATIPDGQLDIIANQYFYSDKFPEVKLSCAGVTWDEKTVIIFREGTDIIFQSNSPGPFPKIARTENNTQIVLTQAQKSGWKNLQCTVQNRHSVRLTIPYFSEVKVTHSPADYKLDQTYSLGCEGYVLPTNAMTGRMRVNFYLNDDELAQIDGQFVIDSWIRGIEVGEEVIGNNTITFTPSRKSNQGKYRCELQFRMQNVNLHTAESNNVWNAVL